MNNRTEMVNDFFDHYVSDFGYTRQYKEYEGIDVTYDKEYLKKYDRFSPKDTKRLINIRVDLFMSNFLQNSTNLLDVGYGRGEFLNNINSRDLSICYGYDPIGTELDEGVVLLEEDDIFEFKFDVVTFFDSLEHVNTNDIKEYLSRFKTAAFIISVPWYHSNAGIDWFYRWNHRRPNEHIHHFDSAYLIRILNDLGYNIKSIGNPEDVIRKSSTGLPNILTIVAERR